MAIAQLALIVIPALGGIALGVRGWRFGARHLGTTALAVNALVATYLVVTALPTLLIG